MGGFELHRFAVKLVEAEAARGDDGLAEVTARFDFESVLREEDGGLLRAASGTLRHFLGEAARQGELFSNYSSGFAALRDSCPRTSAMRGFELDASS